MKYLKRYKIFEEVVNSTNLKESNDYKNGKFWQCIMNLGYDMWQQEGNGINSDNDMHKYIEETYGKDFRLMIHLGNYYQQVYNGGHAQYWDNGYASTESSGTFSDHKEANIVDWMIETIKNSHILRMDAIKRALPILEKFLNDVNNHEDSCDYCDGYGNIEEDCYNCDGGEVSEDCEDCEDGEDEDGNTCGTCGGSGETTESCGDCDGGTIDSNCDSCDGGTVDLYVDDLDSPLYAIKNFEKDCNTYSKILIDNLYKTQDLYKNINK